MPHSGQRGEAAAEGFNIMPGHPITPDFWPVPHAWQPPADWGVSAHAKHLRNLHAYFRRRAS